ncbi:MAG: hypothetical protein ABIR04_00520, partial [Cypionkella sp.]
NRDQARALGHGLPLAQDGRIDLSTPAVSRQLDQLREIGDLKARICNSLPCPLPQDRKMLQKSRRTRVDLPLIRS